MFVDQHNRNVYLGPFDWKVKSQVEHYCKSDRWHKSKVATFGEEALRPNCFRPRWPKTLIRPIVDCPVVGITVVGTAVVGTAAASRDKHKHYKSSDVLMYFSGQTCWMCCKHFGLWLTFDVICTRAESFLQLQLPLVKCQSLRWYRVPLIKQWPSC